MQRHVSTVTNDLLNDLTVKYNTEQCRIQKSSGIVDVSLCPFEEEDISPSCTIDQSELQHRLNVGLRYTEKSERALSPPSGGELAYISGIIQSSLKRSDIGASFMKNIPEQLFRSFHIITKPSPQDLLEIILQILSKHGASFLRKCLTTGRLPAHLLRNIINHYHAESSVPYHVSLVINVCSQFMFTNSVNLTLLEVAREIYLKTLSGTSNNLFHALNPKTLTHDVHNHRFMHIKKLDEFYRVEASVNKFYAQKLLDYVFGTLANPFLGSLTLSTIGGSMYKYHKPSFDNSLAVFCVHNGLRNGILSDPIEHTPVYSYKSVLPSSLYLNPDEATGNLHSGIKGISEHSSISISNLYAYSGRFFVVEHTEPFTLCATLPGMAYRLAIFYSLPERMKDIGTLQITKTIINNFYSCNPSAYTGAYSFNSMESNAADYMMEGSENDGDRQIDPQSGVFGHSGGNTTQENNISNASTANVSGVPNASNTYSHEESENRQRASYYLFPPIAQSQLLEIDNNDENIPFIHPITKTIVSKLTSTVTPHLVGPHGYAQCCFYGQKNRFLLVKNRNDIVTQDTTGSYTVSTVITGASSLQLRSTNWVLRELPTVCLTGQFFPTPNFTVRHSKSGSREPQKQRDVVKKSGIQDNIDDDKLSNMTEPPRKRTIDPDMQIKDNASNASEPPQISHNAHSTIEQSTAQPTDANKQVTKDKTSTGDNVYFVLGPENVKRITKHRIGYFMTRVNMERSAVKRGSSEKQEQSNPVIGRYKDLLGVFAAESFFKDMSDAGKIDKQAKNDEFCTGLVSENHIFYILLLENFLSSGAFVDNFLTQCRADYYLIQVAKMTAENSIANLFLIDRFLGWAQMAFCLLTNYRVSYMHKIRENREYQTYSYIDENAYQSFGAKTLKFGCFTSPLNKLSEQVDNGRRSDLIFKNNLHVFPFSLREDQSMPLLNGIYSAITDQAFNSQILYPYKKLYASVFPKIGLFTRPFMSTNKTPKKDRGQQRGGDMVRKEEQEQKIFDIMNKVFELGDQPDIHGTNCNAALLPKTSQKASAPDDIRIHIEKFGLCTREIELCMSCSPQELRRFPLEKFNVVATGTLSKILEEHGVSVQDGRMSGVAGLTGAANSNVEGLPTRIRRAFKEHLHPVNIVLSMKENRSQKISQGQPIQSGLDRSDKNNMFWSTYMQKIIECIDATDIRDILTTEQHNIIHIHALRAMDNKNQEKLTAARYKLKRATMFLTGETIISSHNLGADAMSYKSCPFLSKKVLKDAGEERAEQIVSGYMSAITEHTFADLVSGSLNSQTQSDETLVASFNNYSNYSAITVKPHILLSCLSNDKHQIPEEVSRELSNQQSYTCTAYPFMILYGMRKEKVRLTDESVKSLVKSCTRKWSDAERQAMCEISKIIRTIHDRKTLFNLRIISQKSGLTWKDMCLVLDSSAQAKNIKDKQPIRGRGQRTRGAQDGETIAQQEALQRSKISANVYEEDAYHEEASSGRSQSLLFVDKIEMSDYTIHDQIKEYWDPRKCLFGIARLFERLSSKPVLIYGVANNNQYSDADVTVYPHEEVIGLDGRCFLSGKGREILYCSSIMTDMSIVSDYTRGNINLALASNIKKLYPSNVQLFVISKQSGLSAQLERLAKVHGGAIAAEHKIAEYSSLIRESYLSKRMSYIELYSYPGFSLDALHYGIIPTFNTKPKLQYKHRTVTIPKLPLRDTLNTSFFAAVLSYSSPVSMDSECKKSSNAGSGIFTLTQDKVRSYITELDRCSEEYWPTAPSIHCLLICENALAEEKWLLDQQSSQAKHTQLFYTTLVKNKGDPATNEKLQLGTLETQIDFQSEIINALRFSQDMRMATDDRLKTFLNDIASLKYKTDPMEGLVYWFNKDCFTDTKDYTKYTKFIESPVFLKDIQAHRSKSKVRECIFKSAFDIIQDVHKMTINALQYNLVEPEYTENPLSRVNREKELDAFLSENAKVAIVLWYATELMARLRRFYRENSLLFALLGVAWIKSNFSDSLGTHVSLEKVKALILGAHYHIMRYYVRPYETLLAEDCVSLGRKQQQLCRKRLESLSV